MTKSDISLITTNDECINLKFVYHEVDEAMDCIVFDDNKLLFIYHIFPDHPDIKPYYRVKYSNNTVYCANDAELIDYLRSFFYIHKLCQ